MNADLPVLPSRCHSVTTAAEYFSMAAGVDMAPLLEGLNDDSCHAPHWGYVLSGQVIVTYGDGGL